MLKSIISNKWIWIKNPIRKDCRECVPNTNRIKIFKTNKSMIWKLNPVHWDNKLILIKNKSKVLNYWFKMKDSLIIKLNLNRKTWLQKIKSWLQILKDKQWKSNLFKSILILYSVIVDQQVKWLHQVSRWFKVKVF